MKLLVRALVGAMALAMVSTGAANATTGSPPVTVDDAVTMTITRPAEVNVLANDSDPDGDTLAVCRLGTIPRALEVDTFDGSLMIFAGRAGTYTFTYYACDYSYLTPGTVTVTVEPMPKLYAKVVKGERPGTLRVFNNGRYGFNFLWGGYRSPRADGHVRVPAHTSLRIRVRRVSLVWIALNQHKGAYQLGIVRGIQLPKGTHALPPGAPPASSSLGAFRGLSARWGVSGR